MRVQQAPSIAGVSGQPPPIFTHAERRSRGTDDSYALSRAWMTFRWPDFSGLVNADWAGLGGGQDRDGPLAAEGKLLGGHMPAGWKWGPGRPTNRSKASRDAAAD